MAKWTALAISATLSIAIAGSACVVDQVPTLDRVGVTTEGDDISVLFVGCDGDSVERVTLYSRRDGEDADDPVLWEIVATPESDGAQVQQFTPGEVPSGFAERVAYQDRLQSSDDGFVVVTSRQEGTLGVSFSVDELSTNEVVVAGSEPRGRSEFVDKAAEGCPDD